MVLHLMLEDDEKNMSSTWRELKAIELALASFKNELQEMTVKWFTDNQSCEKIVHSGSMKHYSQFIAYNIFKMYADNKISLDVQWVPRLGIMTKQIFLVKLSIRMFGKLL